MVSFVRSAQIQIDGICEVRDIIVTNEGRIAVLTKNQERGMFEF